MTDFTPTAPPDPPTPAPEPETPQTSSHERWPADYYQSEKPPRRFFPKWAIFGCGGAALLVLVLVFAGGAMISRGGFNEFIDFTIGMSLGEMRAMYDPAVPAADKARLESELEKMRESLRTDRLSVASIQPFLQVLRGVIEDKKVTREEVGLLRQRVEQINATARAER